MEREPYRLEHVTNPGASSYAFTWDGTRAYLAWHDIILTDGEMAGDDLAPVRIKDMRDRMTFLPEGMRVHGWCAQRERANAFTTLCFDQSWAFEQAETPDRGRRPKHQIYFRSPTVLALMQRLTGFARQGDKPASALVDSVALLAISEVLALQSACKSSGNLGDDQLTAAKDFICAHLSQDISLREIAAAVGLSTFYFCRAFKNATGLSPYRYVLELRTERAKQLIAETNTPIAEIAALCGFNSPHQFSRTFAKLTGVAPRDYRAGVK